MSFFAANHKILIMLLGLFYYWIAVCYGAGFLNFAAQVLMRQQGWGQSVCPSNSVSQCADRRPGLYAETVVWVALAYTLVDTYLMFRQGTTDVVGTDKVLGGKATAGDGGNSREGTVEGKKER